MQGPILANVQQGIHAPLRPTLAPAEEHAPAAIRPPLKWVGGKRWLLPYLHPLWEHNRNRRLVEPLCGGLAVSLGLRPRRALLNDLNLHLVNFYRWVKRGLHITLSMKNDRTLYDAHRSRFNQLIAERRATTREAAELFYYLNRTGYNGLCRFNRRGEFNVPFGKYRQINYVVDFSQYRSILADWELTTSDFQHITVQPEDFIYADPPYDVDFTQYSKDSFTWEDQVRLAQWLARHPGPVVLSNQATKRVVRLYTRLGFQLFFLQAPRMISCDGDRTPAKEVLAVRGMSL